MMAFDERALFDVYIHQCVCSKIEGECKEILSKNRHQHKKPSLSNSRFGFQVVILQKCSKWTVLSKQLFVQLLFIPPLTKVRGSFFLCWISRIWLLRKSFVRKSGTPRWHMEKHLHVSLFFLHFYPFLFIPVVWFSVIFIPFFSSSFLCFPSGIQKLAKLDTFEWIFLHKKPSLSNSQFGFQVVILQKCSKWTVLSGQLFIQLLFIPPLTKVGGSFFLCWTSRIWLLRKFFVRKSGTLRWHIEKSPACFFVFLHLYPFLFIPVFSYLFLVLLFIPLFPFKFPIWVLPSRDPPKMFNMNSFRWTVVYTIALHSSTDQKVVGLLFLCWISRIWLLRKSFVRKSGTLRWHMEKHLHVSLFFAFLSIPLHSCCLILIPFFSSSFLCFPSGIQKLAKLDTFEWIFLHKKPSLSNSQLGLQVVILQKCSKWTVLSGKLFIQLLFIPPLTKVRGSFFLCWISRIWLLRKFFVRKSGTLRWHMEKRLHVSLFFCISIHSSSFLLFDFQWFLFLFSPLHSFVSLPGSKN